MALVIKDRVKETTTSTGTGSITLAGAEEKYIAFGSVLSNSDTVYYAIEHSGSGVDEWEVGIGTYTSSTDSISRDTILSSSNSDSAVNFSIGTKTIFATYPADKAIYEDASGDVDVSGDITVGGTVDGRDLATDGTKLDGIESGATADQTAAEIKTAYESNSDTNAFTDAEQTKLSGIEANADVTDTTNVTAAGALMDSEVTNLAQVKAFDSSDYATAAQGTTADAALPKAGGTMTGAITFAAGQTFDGRDVSADGSKLDGIESGATADQTASEILTAIKTVDGAASGLDADLLDGNHASAFATSAQGILADSAVQPSDNVSTLTNDSGYITGNQTITLSGDVSGSGTTSISVTVADDSHNHVISNVDGLQAALDAKLDDSQKGANNGLAELDSSGKVPSSQLPSYVDDVLEYAAEANFPATGETGKLYVALDTNDVYRWSGSAYVKVSDAVSTADQATQLATARTISLTGDVSGSTSFDGSSNVSITATVADDSHNHIISNVDGLQTALDAKADDSTTITAGNGLTGGGSLGANRTINVGAGTGVTVNANDVAIGQDVATTSNVTFNNITVTGTVDGRDVAADGTKLDGIESGATADQTITAGTGLTGGGTGNVTISHADTSTLSGTYGSTGDGTKIDQITVDANGHVTAITTGATGDIQGVTAGSGLSGGGTSGTVTLSHSDTSSQASVNNSGRTYIQDITLDTYGHVTGISSATETVTNTNQLTTFQLEDGDGTEVTISHGKEVKFVEAGGININWTDTSTGSDGDPYDMSFSINTGVTAGNGLTGGGTLNATRTLNVGAGSGITVSADAVAHADTSTLSGTYGSVGDGTKIDEITVDAFGHITAITTGATGDIKGVTAGSGLTGGGTSGTVTVSHADTSSQASVDNSDDTVIQDITLDTYGHVTGIGSKNLDDIFMRKSATSGLDMNNNNITDVEDIYLQDRIYHDGDTNTYIQFHAADQWRVVTGGTERLEVKNSSPHVLVTGDLNSTSDARLKENVAPIANALSDIKQLEGVSFDWKDTGTRGHGFIAQQVEPILPDVVQTDDETGIKSINYVGMIGHLVEAIKEQQIQIDALKVEIEEMKS